ncbi:MAG: hypothetical protein JXA67_10870 [Micromonosporaceae bacterium]|nr:hypothetical protein [Micromonosporaceae bacterium]
MRLTSEAGVLVNKISEEFVAVNKIEYAGRARQSRRLRALERTLMFTAGLGTSGDLVIPTRRKA